MAARVGAKHPAVHKWGYCQVSLSILNYSDEFDVMIPPATETHKMQHRGDVNLPPLVHDGLCLYVIRNVHSKPRSQ